MYSQTVLGSRGPGDGNLFGDLDGEWEGTLPDTTISSRPSWPLGDVGVWPSIWRLAPDIQPSKLLDLAAIDTIVVAVNQNSGLNHTIRAQGPLQEMKKPLVCTNCVFSMVIGILFIHHQWAPLQMWGCF